MVVLRPKTLKKSKYIANEIVLPEDYQVPCFVIHPPTSKLAEMLVVDSTALQNENYSGIYDESGDYVPQYCDDPEQIPRGSMVANEETTEPSPTGAEGGDDKSSKVDTPKSDEPGE